MVNRIVGVVFFLIAAGFGLFFFAAVFMHCGWFAPMGSSSERRKSK